MILYPSIRQFNHFISLFIRGKNSFMTFDMNFKIIITKINKFIVLRYNDLRYPCIFSQIKNSNSHLTRL